MTRVAFLSPLYFHVDGHIGGGERYPLYLARGIHRASGGSVSVEIVSFGKRDLAVEMEQGVSLRVLAAAADPKAPTMLRQLSWQMPEVIAAADLVHVHQYLTTCGEIGILLSHLHQKPVCVTDHGGADSHVGTSLGLGAFVDRYVCYSDFQASFLQSTDPVRIVKGGVDADYFCPGEGPAMREGFLYVGRLLPHKGIDVLLEALPADLPLTVCGTPYHAPYYERLQQLAKGKSVEFITGADDLMVRELYRRSWATILPSVWRDCYGIQHGMPELMGLTMLESMACGTPAVCSDVAALPEFVDHGSTGYVFSSPAELTDHLTRLASDPALCDELGRNARNRITSDWSADVAGARLLDVYRELGLAQQSTTPRQAAHPA